MRIMLLEQNPDETAFVHLVNNLIIAAADAHQVPSFYVVKIDNWFGPNWLGFNHKILGAVGTFVVDGSKPRLVPPFTPSRILSTCRYVRVSAAVHEAQPGKLHVYQNSEDNSRRKLDSIMSGVGAFWWSSASRENGRGSLMAYLPGNGGHFGWYVNFKRSIQSAFGGEVTTWTPAQLRGTTRNELDAYLKFEARAALH